ncbi:MAG: DUF4397 domain-containing protein [Myxococcota bacterium]
MNGNAQGQAGLHTRRLGMSMHTLSMLVATACLEVGMLSGCAQDCGEGTEELNGVCRAIEPGSAVDQVVCGEGTLLVDRRCLPLTVTCGPDTMLVDGACVNAQTCGVDTRGDQGLCVPADTICAGDTSFNTDSGRCENVSASACGAGTVPEPIENAAVDAAQSQCVVDPAAVCGAGTVLGDEGRCVPAARVQVIHMSADPAAATVDVWVSGADGGSAFRLLDDFEFRSATRFVDLLPGSYDIVVAPGDSDAIDDGILTLDDVGLTAGLTAQLVARGVLDADGFASNPDGQTIEFTLDVLTDAAVVDPTPGDDRFLARILHASTDAPTVAVPSLGVGPLSYEERTGNTDLPAGVNAFEIEVAGSGTRVASLQTSFANFQAAPAGVLGDSTALIVANGFVTPSDNQNGAAFGLHAVFANGRVEPLDRAARVQVVHNAEAAGAVDVYVTEPDVAPVLGDGLALSYRQASPFITIEGGVSVDIYVVASGMDPTVSAAQLIVANDVLMPLSDSRVVALDGPDSTPPFLQILANAREAPADAESVALQVLHGSPDAGAVDVFADKFFAGAPSGALGDDLNFADATNAVEVDAVNRVISVTAPDDATVAVVDPITAPLSGFAGESLLVMASGSVQSSFALVAIPAGDGSATVDGVVLSGGVAETQFIQNRADEVEETTDPETRFDVFIGAGPTPAARFFTFQSATEVLTVPIPVDVVVTEYAINSVPLSDRVDLLEGRLVGYAPEVGSRNVFVASGTLPTSTETTSFDLFEREIAVGAAGQVELNVFHGVVDVGAVSVSAALAEGSITISDALEFGDFAEPVSLMAGPDGAEDDPLADVTVSVAAGDTTFMFSGVDLTPYAGSALTVCASGAVEDESFGLLVVAAVDADEDGSADVLVLTPDEPES